MKFMRYFSVVFVLFCLGFKDQPQSVAFYRIPAQTFDPWAELDWKCHDTITLDSFFMTPQITLLQYRDYLAAMKRDSGVKYFESQLPDSGFCTDEQYRRYYNTKEFNDFPVCGVSWVNAMNYCRWRTSQDSLPAGWEYRLPFMDEWLAAYRHLNTVQKGSDMNKDYADWLMNSNDEWWGSTDHTGKMTQCDFLLFNSAWPDDPNDLPVLRRKRIIGNSFHMQHSSLGDFIGEYGYSYEGYAWVSFRMVKVPVDSRTFKRSITFPKDRNRSKKSELKN